MLLKQLLLAEEVNQQPNTFRIPEWNLNQFQDLIEKVNKRAQKLGVPPLRVIQGKIERVNDPEYEGKGLSDNEIPKISVVEYTIEGDPPKLAGWTFLATLDHNTLPGQVIVNVVPGQQIPQQFYNAPPVCDHCNKRRQRNETFVLRNDNGQYMKVGRQCLRDFLGHDPSRVISMMQSLYKLIETLSRGGGPRGDRAPEYGTDIRKVLQYTGAVINNVGWVSRSAANNEAGRPATAEIVSELLTPPWRASAYELQQWRNKREQFDVENQTYLTQADQAIEWLDTQPENASEYIHNLHMIKKAGHVPARMMGYWVSLVPTYLKAQEKLKANQKVNKVNEYFGNVGDKVEIDVTLEQVRHANGYYGVVHIHKFRNEQGNTLIWFANTAKSDMEVGKKYRIKATIKNHSEYQGWKQTQLTRVKMVQQLLD